MIVLLAITAGALVLSLLADRRKTLAGVRKGLTMFLSILPALAGVLAGVSLLLAAVTPDMLRDVLGGSGPLPFVVALLVGSVALMPGFIAYPLAGVLRANGASNPVLAAFITTLMMVGVVTLPIEARFLGWRVALWRNALAFAGAVVVALGMTLVLG
ncbi:MAG: permease [Myxococcales bacterium]|nr:permease [Myxococcales bacterium]